MSIASRFPLESTYQMCLQTNLITGINAASATAGRIGAFRWIDPSYFCLVHRVRAVWATVAGFTAEQRVGMDVVVGRSYTGNHTGVVSPLTYDVTTASCKLKATQTSLTTSIVGEFACSDTGVITNASVTLDAQPLAACEMVELATGAGVYRGVMALEKDFVAHGKPPLVLTTSEGLVFRNLVAMGAAGTARVTFTIEFSRQPMS